MSDDTAGQQFGWQSGVPGTVGAPGPSGGQPPTYRGWSIAAIIGGVLFNLILGAPAGFVARRYGQQVRTLWASGDQPGATRASRSARTWAIVSTVLDTLGLVVLVFVIVLGSNSTAQSGFHNPAAVAASIKTLIQKRLNDPSSQYYSPGVKVTSVVCTPAGPNTDTCVETLSNGQSGSETAVISANGQSFVTR
jgi:Interferon-induced transmembrane protein